MTTIYITLGVVYLLFISLLFWYGPRLKGEELDEKTYKRAMTLLLVLTPVWPIGVLAMIMAVA